MTRVQWSHHYNILLFVFLGLRNMWTNLTLKWYSTISKLNGYNKNATTGLSGFPAEYWCPGVMSLGVRLDHLLVPSLTNSVSDYPCIVVDVVDAQREYNLSVIDVFQWWVLIIELQIFTFTWFTLLTRNDKCR